MVRPLPLACCTLLALVTNGARGQSVDPYAELLQLYVAGDLPYAEHLWRPGQTPAVPPLVDYPGAGTPAVFTPLPVDPPPDAPRTTAGIALLLGASLGADKRPPITEYVADLQSEGYGVTVTSMQGGTAADVRAWVQQRYAAGDEGVVFVGTLPLAWMQVDNDVFPTDLYFMDVDGTWIDTNSDGDYDLHLDGDGDRLPEVYAARLWPATQTWDTPRNLIEQYFAKAHAYRTGALRRPSRALEYVDEDWCMHAFACELAYGSDVARGDFGHLTRRDDYLAQLGTDGFQFVHLGAHSGHEGHGWGNNPTFSAGYAHIYVHSPVPRSAVVRLGMDEGLKVWLNGEVLFALDKNGATCVPDEFSVAATLPAGWSRLLCKVTQDAGWWRSAIPFSVRITDGAGATLPDLTYQLADPELASGPALSFPHSIDAWLVNGVYEQHEFGLRLHTDYLGGEATARPHPGVAAPFDAWRPFVDAEAPTDLHRHFEDTVYPPGGWLSSYDVHALDLPVLFWNLWACGAGQFWRENCVADTYIFGTSRGLVSIASTTGGGLWHTAALLEPLSHNATFGAALLNYWHAHPAEALSYGNVLRGDPTLRLFKRGDLNGDYAVDFRDINPFVRALTDWAGYRAEQPTANAKAGDLNDDGVVDFGDINPFIALVAGG